MKHFTLKELTDSITAKNKNISNNPNEQETKNLVALVENVLDPLREQYGKPIIVSSGYRCIKLNMILGGAYNSQHIFGKAADIRSLSDSFKDNKELFDAILKSNLPFCQLIYEFGNDEGPDWIHISYDKNNIKREVLRAYKLGKNTIYKKI